jgi:uncharacterized membrane protein YkvI
MAHRVITAVALVFVACLAFLTFADLVKNGVTMLGVISFAVLALFVVGILGALAQPPDDR